MLYQTSYVDLSFMLVFLVGKFKGSGDFNYAKRLFNYKASDVRFCVWVCVCVLLCSLCYKSPAIPHAPTPFPLLLGHFVTYSFVLNSSLKVAWLSILLLTPKPRCQTLQLMPTFGNAWDYDNGLWRDLSQASDVTLAGDLKASGEHSDHLLQESLS